MMFSSLLALALIAPGDPPTPLDVVSALETATSDAIAKVQPSVVAIARVRGDEPDKTIAILGEAAVVNPLEGPDQKAGPFDYTPPGDFSSGVVIGPDNAILTTYHSLRGAVQIWVRTSDKQEFEAVILAADPRSDLAVIVPRPTNAGPPPKLTPIAVGDATRMKAGTFLLTLGNSFNAARDGKASAGWGILANTSRRVHAPLPEDPKPSVRTQFFRYQPTLLQLDARLNLGMSGGAVVNMKGQLVGVTTADGGPVAYDVQAGYAIPMDALGRRVINTLRLGKEVEYGFLGIGLKKDVPNGVSTVARGTPADKADLVVNDVILSVGDRVLDEEDGLTMALALIPPGQDVTLKVRRNDQVIEKTIYVSKYPVNGQVIAVNRPKPWRGMRVDYSSVLTSTGAFDFELIQAMGQGGIGITEVETGSAAANAGLRKNQIITEVDGQPVSSPSEFLKLVAKKEGKDVTITQPGREGPQNVVVKK